MGFHVSLVECKPSQAKTVTNFNVKSKSTPQILAISSKATRFGIKGLGFRGLGFRGLGFRV